MTYALRLGSMLIALCAPGVPVRAEDAGVPPAPRNVVLVTTDGLRWQEVFRGADESLLNKEDGGVADPDALRRKFWRETPEERREALMPFLWTTLARQGQVFGNRDKKSLAHVTNGKNFSYPGYNEMFSGFPDPRIDSNAKRPNPNVSVLEWLNLKPAFRGKVAAVASWDVFPFILNVERSGLTVNAGWMPLVGPSLTAHQHHINRRMSRSIRHWPDCRYDVLTLQFAMEYLRRATPRVFYVGLGDTDEYAHGGRYDRYLRAAHQADSALKALWEELQSHPQYRGTTTLVVTTDHGRGDSPRGWRGHGETVEGSGATWLAALGPDTPALGERSESRAVTQSQVAATIAALLGEDYNAEVPRAAAPITDVIRPGAVGAASAATLPARRAAPGPFATRDRARPAGNTVATAAAVATVLTDDPGPSGGDRSNDAPSPGTISVNAIALEPSWLAWCGIAGLTGLGWTRRRGRAGPPGDEKGAL